MDKNKGENRFANIGAKDVWHLYSLQSLPGKRFIATVNKILNQKYILINSKKSSKSSSDE